MCFLTSVSIWSYSNEITISTTADPDGCLNVNSSALDQAKGIQANSFEQFPSFLKQLLKSHLSGKFYLGLPKKFCDAHLPSHDGSIILVDENDQEYNTKYSVRKNRLSGGWRGFSIEHKLLEGDALVFHLIEPCKFRVYIVRAGKITENEGAIGLQTYDFQNIKPISAVKMEDQMEENACTGKTARQVYLNSLEVVDSHHETKKARLTPDSEIHMHHSANSIDQFKDISGFENFKIQSGGLILDSEIPKNIRAKYYNLCCSQRMFLHDHLINGLSTKLAVVMISETTNISEAVRSADVSTSLHHLECWEKTLKAFEDLGMAVGFIRNRLHKLLEISREAQSNNESKMTVKTQADHVSGNLETSSLNVEALIGSLEAEIESLRWKNEKLGFEFRELARAPW
ncbi:PREDICTED: B3 domain-containing protein Os01g0234100-like isoform X1 [Erythranthe guttata]|uniref:B3 domain-containing protein Os01g0234100-like isoform X1 n=1 Tax=Erythranthe guttata TaxID=4155 RepID=UPI00064DD205|nr:PREDICTED: B3 domain-containing protein Os01g0234100-like isoform X1 [Erythranthe guttata]|eukprot:XP_012836956.1 PREDICTED: B3 domain-containing protein Os01g0234100-like isoform X1 [Erythranthe guttata]